MAIQKAEFNVDNLSVTGGSVNTVVHGLLMGHATVLLLVS